METTAANSVSTVIKEQFDLQTRLFNNVLEGIEDTESNDRPNEQVNHMKWIAGHLVSSRQGMCEIGGFEPLKKIEDQFGHGKSIDPNANYMSIKELKEQWNEIAEPIKRGIENMPETAWEEKSQFGLPISDQTMRGMLGFLMHHEAYHIGQMGILRKYLGKEAMSYK